MLGCGEAVHAASIWLSPYCGFILEKDNQVKLKCLAAAMAASRMSRKSTYTTWLRIFMRGMVVGVATWWRPSWRTCSPGTWCQVARRKVWTRIYSFGHLDHEGGSSRAGPDPSRVFARLAGQMCQQCGPINGEVWCGHIRRLVLLQMFLWEQLSILALNSMEYPDGLMEETMFLDGFRRMRPSNTHKPRAWRWLNAK